MKLFDEPLSLTHPEIASEWSERNYPHTPEQVTAGSHDRVWWKGKSCGHEWQTSVGNRCINGTGCPYCSSRKILKGFNDLKTRHPELVEEWSDRNGYLKPSEVGAFSRKKVWWKCKNGHEWQATVNSRSQGNGCRICSNKVVLAGFNDLASQRPDLAKEWSDKNLPVTPDKVLWKKHASYWWKCSSCGNEYEAWLSVRIKRGTDCPFCAGYIVKQGYNDLSKTDPEIAEEWDQTGNKNLKPEDFYRTSLRFVRWRCRFGHSYGMKIRDRTVNGKGCVICEKTFQAAFMQMLIMRYAKRNGIAYEIGKDGFELYLPEQRMAFVAQKISAPEEKLQKKRCSDISQMGITVVILPRADDLYTASFLVRKGFEERGITIDSDVEEDIKVLRMSFFGEDKSTSLSSGGGFAKIHGRLTHEFYKNPEDLTKTHPYLCEEWSERNFPFKPSDEHYKSDSKVWWKCRDCGFEWKALIRNRTEHKTGCPACSGKRVVPGFNDLKTVAPDIAKQWSSKNKGVSPQDVTKHSCRKVWWKCDKGHEWQATIGSRTIGNGCPVCAKDPIIKGVNDLATTHPDILKKWSDKNTDVTPSKIGINYKKQVWWKCEVCGADYKAQPKTVLSIKGPGCKNCTSKVGRGWKEIVREEKYKEKNT